LLLFYEQQTAQSCCSACRCGADGHWCGAEVSGPADRRPQLGLRGAGHGRVRGRLDRACTEQKAQRRVIETGHVITSRS
jgi:hypothetical protein